MGDCCHWSLLVCCVRDADWHNKTVPVDAQTGHLARLTVVGAEAVTGSAV